MVTGARPVTLKVDSRLDVTTTVTKVVGDKSVSGSFEQENKKGISANKSRSDFIVILNKNFTGPLQHLIHYKCKIFSENASFF